MGRSIEKSSENFGWWDLCRAYWFLLGETKWRWLFLVSLLFLIQFYTLVPPLILGKVVDFFAAYHPGDSINRFYFYIGGLGVSLVIVSFVRLSLKKVISNLQSEVTYETKVSGFARLLDFSLSWHLVESAGTKAQRITAGVESYKVLNHYLSNEIMRSVTGIIGTALVFLFLRPQYVVFFLIYIIGFWAILTFFYRRINHENDLYFASIEKASGSYMEGLSNILTIKTLGAGGDFKKHIARREQRTKEHEFVMRNLYNNLWKSFQAFNGISYGIFLFAVGKDVVAQNISPGAFVIFYGYLQALISNAADMIEAYEKTLSAKAGVGRMMSIFWTETTAVAGTKKLPQNWKEIEIQDACFEYKKADNKTSKKEGGAPPINTLQNISLAIPRYAKIGVVGKTGSGKSTLAKLLAGLYPLASGKYMIGNTSFYDLAHEEQTKHITLVLQETEVFNMSLRDNITLLRKMNPQLLERALIISQLSEVVAKLPEGLDTIVGEKGYHLSGGERQRVGIARAICKDSPIMIFDEATSSLDSKTEFLIQEALEMELTEKTLVIIAHRVSTLQKTDMIYVFDQGSIVEQGIFSELSRSPKSKFFELYHTQRQHIEAPVR